MNQQVTRPGTEELQLEIGDFVLYAEQRLTLGTTNRITGGDIGVRSAASGQAGGQLVAGAGSVMDPDHNIVSPSVTLGNEVTSGAIPTNILVDPAPSVAASPAAATPGPSAQSFPVSVMPTLPLAVAPSAGTETVTVPAGQTTSLTPGSYASVTVDGALALNAGNYVFASIQLGQQAQLTSARSLIPRGVQSMERPILRLTHAQKSPICGNLSQLRPRGAGRRADPGLSAGSGRGDLEDPGGAGRDRGRAGQPARDCLTRGPCQVPAAAACDGRRGNQPWSVIITPVSA
jgi:hypothetical protein